MAAEFMIGGALGVSCAVTTGVEKLNCIMAVPTMPPSVSIVESTLPNPGEARHVAIESEIQEVVAHGVGLTPAVGEKLTLPKLLPLNVMAAPPEVGAFEGPDWVSSGASKVKSWTSVLVCWATIAACMLTIGCPRWEHTRQVSVTQVDVRHAPPIRTVEDVSVGPKLTPNNVTDAPPLCPPFASGADETAGASKVSNQLDWNC